MVPLCMHQILIRAWLMKRTPVILKLKVNAICAAPLLSPTKVMNQTSGDPSASERAPNSSWIEQWAEPFRPSIQEFLPLEIISPSSRDWASTPFCTKINATWRRRKEVAIVVNVQQGIFFLQFHPLSKYEVFDRRSEIS